MPVYTYRREDGTTFDVRQKFTDDPLTVDPETGQKVQRVIHASSIIFKGSGFYVTDNKSAAKTTATPGSNGASNGNAENGATTEAKSDAKTTTSADTTSTTADKKPESKVS